MEAQQAPIPDFTDHELWLIRSTTDERYGKGKIELMQVDVELRLSPADKELTLCPAIYWEDNDCKFILAKVDYNKRTGVRKYRSQFFYRNYQHYGEAEDEIAYVDLGDCVVNLLKLQEKYEEEDKNKPVDMRGVAQSQ